MSALKGDRQMVLASRTCAVFSLFIIHGFFLHSVVRSKTGHKQRHWSFYKVTLHTYSLFSCEEGSDWRATEGSKIISNIYVKFPSFKVSLSIIFKSTVAIYKSEKPYMSILLYLYILFGILSKSLNTVTVMENIVHRVVPWYIVLIHDRAQGLVYVCSNLNFSDFSLMKIFSRSF